MNLLHLSPDIKEAGSRPTADGPRLRRPLRGRHVLDRRDPGGLAAASGRPDRADGGFVRDPAKQRSRTRSSRGTALRTPTPSCRPSAARGRLPCRTAASSEARRRGTSDPLSDPIAIFPPSDRDPLRGTKMKNLDDLAIPAEQKALGVDRPPRSAAAAAGWPVVPRTVRDRGRVPLTRSSPWSSRSVPVRSSSRSPASS
jgi:hypothetical protein